MRTAVDDVHHRNGERVRVGAADVAVERKTERSGSGLCDGEGHAEDGVGAELGLRGGAVKLEHEVIDTALIAGAQTDNLGSDDLVDIGNGLGNALAEVALGVAVAKLKSLVHARGCARRDCRTTERAVLKNHINFNRRITAGVNDFPRRHFLDCSVHVFYPLTGKLARSLPSSDSKVKLGASLSSVALSAS